MEGAAGRALWVLIGLGSIWTVVTSGHSSDDLVIKKRDPALPNHTYGVDDPIVFPTTKPIRAFKPTCDQDICESVADYPSEDELQDLLQSISPSYAEYVRSYDSSLQSLATSQGIGIRSALGQDTAYEPLCQEEEHIVFPKAGKDIRNNVHFIAQTPDVKQRVRVVTCRNKGAACGGDDLPDNTHAECTQQYASRKLLAVNESRAAVMSQFVIPSGCACHHKKQTFVRYTDS